MSAKNTEAKRINPVRLAKTKNGLTALAQLQGYDPHRIELSPAALVRISKDLADAVAEELAANNAAAKARDKAVAAEWAAYNFLIDAVDEVAGQYGSNSDEYASLGYKKKSEYKKTAPGRGKSNKKDQ